MAEPAPTTPLRICVVSHFAYGAMTGGSNGHIGGVERQTSLLACWLAARGHDVSLVTWDEGQEEATEIDGVRVLKLCRREDGFAGIRFLHPRWTSLLRALRRANADVYYQNCGECVTGQVALWCRQRGVGFVFSAAANADCDKYLPHLPAIRERMLHRLGCGSLIAPSSRRELSSTCSPGTSTARQSFSRCPVPHPAFGGGRLRVREVQASSLDRQDL